MPKKNTNHGNQVGFTVLSAGAFSKEATEDNGSKSWPQVPEALGAQASLTCFSSMSNITAIML